MISESKKNRIEIFNLMNTLADSVVDLPDEDIEEEIREDGDNTEEIRSVLLNAITLGKKQSLIEARRQYEAEVVNLRNVTHELPPTASEKRGLIRTLIDAMTVHQEPLTAQFRDYESMPDEDLDSVLTQLLALQSTEDNEGES